ncbi:hypothetical protein [Aquimarina sp. 2201CG5-10]|uniref:hypothetical protein n=1 Tax=Aquimarina callyspongiae TaxID=3098150 RepID=UPI002AB4F7F1|nr:hypothetical protein [Aquimarina sp. 2201CG5-10]MDY8135591.1 hypothetical protein [Aquimarina sp. 2201CG5-10]
MKKASILLIVLLYSSTMFSQEHTIIDNDSIISWDTVRKLTWDDFKAVKHPDEHGLHDSMTTYKLEILPEVVAVDEEDNIHGYEKMDIATYFYKKQSWMVKRDVNLLIYEQLHFDIAELFARMMRRGFAELKRKKISKFSKYQTVYTDFWRYCKSYQRQLNEETQNGRIKEAVQQWSDKIYKELEELQEFSR